jgi:hypothetical protein
MKISCPAVLAHTYDVFSFRTGQQDGHPGYVVHPALVLWGSVSALGPLFPEKL